MYIQDSSLRLSDSQVESFFYTFFSSSPEVPDSLYKYVILWLWLQGKGWMLENEAVGNTLMTFLCGWLIMWVLVCEIPWKKVRPQEGALDDHSHALSFLEQHWLLSSHFYSRLLHYIATPPIPTYPLICRLFQPCSLMPFTSSRHSYSLLGTFSNCTLIFAFLHCYQPYSWKISHLVP